MKTLTTKLLLMALLGLLVAVAGCSNDNNPLAPLNSDDDTLKANAVNSPAADTADIVDTAIAAGAFNTLVAAVQAAELEDALRGDGPFTVFAPTDDAFAALPDGLVEQLLQPRNKAKLQELLLYHVVAAEIYSGDLRRFNFPKTLQGQYLWVRNLFYRDIVRVNDAKVIDADIGASNGVIHVIDKVLIPRGFKLDPEAPTLDIVDTAVAAGSFNTLLAAAGAADLVGALRSDGPLTVFAPTDEAFAKLPTELVEALLMPENKAKLQELLLYHVVSGQVLKENLSYYQKAETLAGSDVRIIKWFGNVWVNWSRVTTADVLTTNGVIHVINRVLIPRGFSLETQNAVYTARNLDQLVSERYQDEMPPEDFDMKYIDSAR